MKNQAADRVVYGRIRYRSGELKYEGYYISTRKSDRWLEPLGKGVWYYKTGVVFREGEFQHGGLLEGRENYPTGQIKFEGRFNCREEDSSYYGPTYPVKGKFYAENGTLVFQGEFKIEKQGSVGFPKVVEPAAFGPIV